MCGRSGRNGVLYVPGLASLAFKDVIPVMEWWIWTARRATDYGAVVTNYLLSSLRIYEAAGDIREDLEDGVLRPICWHACPVGRRRAIPLLEGRVFTQTVLYRGNRCGDSPYRGGVTLRSGRWLM